MKTIKKQQLTTQEAINALDYITTHDELRGDDYLNQEVERYEAIANYDGTNDQLVYEAQSADCILEELYYLQEGGR